MDDELSQTGLRPRYCESLQKGLFTSHLLVPQHPWAALSSRLDGDEKRIHGLRSQKWSPMEDSFKKERSRKISRVTQPVRLQT
jgi:hypothetical protein